MKKFFCVVLFLFLFLSIKSVRAEEAPIIYNKLQGIAYNQRIGNDLKSNYVTSFHLKDRIAYCIEPGVAINEKTYDINTDWSTINLSDDIKEYIEKVGYYGYEYPGHNNNYYYIAAQELIWKAVRPDIEVVWTTEKNLGGSVIDISNEKNEIIKLVNDHETIPSFSNKRFEGYVGDELILEDTNGVLDYYDVASSNNHSIVAEDGHLKIKLNDKKVDDEEILLTRKYYDKAPLLIYTRGDSQKLAALRITMDKTSKFIIGNREKTEDFAEVVEVPNTGIGVDFGEILFTILSGIGLIIGAIKIK